MSRLTVESIIESFPTSNIPSVEGEPDYKTIKEVGKIIITNASSMESELGGGQHGLLGLVVSPTRYNTITGNNFVPHENPGALPEFPQNPTQPQIAQINATHKEELRLWRKQNLAIKALKKQLTSAFEAKHLEELHDTCTGYNNVSIQDIFAYLYDKYGDLDEADIENLDKQLAEPFDSSEPFGTFIKRIEDIMEIAEAAGCAYTPAQITSKAFNLICKAQVFPEGCREWKRKANTDKTWSNLKTHFSVEAKEYRKKSSHLAKDTYQTAHAANQALLEAQAEFRDYTSSFISEFQEALNQPHALKQPPKEDSTVQQAHAATAPELGNLIKDLRTQLQESQAQNKLLLSIIQSMGANKENQNPNAPKVGAAQTKWKYCWSCGANTFHTSDKCNKKREGYKEDATFKDTKGGSKYRFGALGVKKILARNNS